MAKKICFVNQKGGVGKTATAQQVIAYLSKRGKKVLAIDLDPQWNLSLMHGVYSPEYEMEGTKDGKTIYQLMKGKPIEDVIIKVGDIDFVCGSMLMACADREFSTIDGFMKVRNAVASVEKKYDYIIMDCPPTVGVVTANALAACDGAVLPYKADSLTKAGILQIKEFIDSVRSAVNKSLKIYGVLVTMYDTRSKASNRAVLDAESVSKILKTKVFTSKIRQSAKMRELADAQKNIFDYAPSAPVAKDYEAFCEELIKEK